VCGRAERSFEGIQKKHEVLRQQDHAQVTDVSRISERIEETGVFVGRVSSRENCVVVERMNPRSGRISAPAQTASSADDGSGNGGEFGDHHFFPPPSTFSSAFLW